MRTETIVIGGGQAGLAVSAELTRHGREHLVLERGRIAERWRSERWDSLHLLTPNWMTRLPGFTYDGDEPDGFMSAAQLASMLTRFARVAGAPVVEQCTVHAVTPIGVGYRVDTDHGPMLATNVVVATGWCERPAIPAGAASLPDHVQQLSPSTYRRPDQMQPGRILVVGASASGAQIAEELNGHGREVVLAVGRHSPVPRTYRGIDIMWWLDRLGVLDRSAHDDASLTALRAEPSLQLAGGPRRAVDLATLASRGVDLVGRLADLTPTTLTFEGGLSATVERAAAGRDRLLDRLDVLAGECGLAVDLPAREPRPPQPTLTDTDGAARLNVPDLAAVVWATGYRRTWDWLPAAALDATGELRQRRGVTPLAGLYTAGMRFQTSRRSTFVDGVRHDAEAVVSHIVRDDRAVRSLNAA